MSSSRARKASALQALRDRRSGVTSGLRTDDYEAHEDKIFDEVNENEYQDLVRRRRDREDFVVDDGEIVTVIKM